MENTDGNKVTEYLEGRIHKYEKRTRLARKKGRNLNKMCQNLDKKQKQYTLILEQYLEDEKECMNAIYLFYCSFTMKVDFIRERTN
jgi:predicted patatin/cPLA2 family phospholipase